MAARLSFNNQLTPDTLFQKAMEKKQYTQPSIIIYQLLAGQNLMFNPNPTSSSGSLPSEPETPGVGQEGNNVKHSGNAVEWEQFEEW